MKWREDLNTYDRQSIRYTGWLSITSSPISIGPHLSKASATKRKEESCCPIPSLRSLAGPSLSITQNFMSIISQQLQPEHCVGGAESECRESQYTRQDKPKISQTPLFDALDYQQSKAIHLGTRRNSLRAKNTATAAQLDSVELRIARLALL
jgi:hypothetical protein